MNSECHTGSVDIHIKYHLRGDLMRNKLQVFICYDVEAMNASYWEPF